MGFFQGLLSGGKSKKTQPTIASGLQLQSSSYGAPIPLVYGTSRLAPNLIWYNNFTATPVSNGGKGGGKGGAGGNSKTGEGQSYTYTVSLQMGICEGPIIGIGNVYQDKTVTTLSALGLSLFTGTYPQAPWGFLVTNYSSSQSESHVIPATGPYTVTVNEQTSFWNDLGVSQSGVAVTYGSVTGSPGNNQYSVIGNGIIQFYSGNAGNTVVIDFVDEFFTSYSSTQNIPSASPYTLSVSTINGDPVTIQSVTATSIGYQRINSSPGVGQYAVTDGVYTFNSGAAGDTVTISYSSLGSGQVLGYNGIAHADCASYQLGQSSALPNMNFEVQGVFANSVTQELIGEQDTVPSAAYTNSQGVILGPNQISVQYAAEFLSDGGVIDTEGNPLTAVASNPQYYQYSVSQGVYTFSANNQGMVVNISYTASVGPDADPSLVVVDILTNEHYGSGFPADRVGSLSVYQAYCIATGLLISPVYNTQQSAATMLDDIATNTNSAWVWSSGLLTLVPYGDQSITANGYTYTAPSSALYSLTDNDFEKQASPLSSGTSAMNDDPVLMMRKRPADQINSVKLECLDRNNNYNTAIVEAKDQALIELFSLRQSGASQSHLFCNLGAGRLSAQLQLQRQAIRNIYGFTLDQRYITLDPMDIVAITDTYLGLNNQWVRIIEIQENDDGTLSFAAEEYLTGTGNAPKYSYQAGSGYASNYNAAPGNVNQPVIFEPTDALAAGLEVWIAVSGVDTALWGGCNIYISSDGNSYVQAGQIIGAARQGVLTASLPSVTPSATGQTIDAVDTLTVNVAESNATLISGSQQDATNLNTLCYVDGEMLAYETATLTGTGQYSLTYLVRGAYDTTIRAHAAGSQFARIDQAIFKYPYAAGLIGTTVYFKFASFNIYGGGIQALTELAPYTYQVQGTAYTSALPNVTGFATAYNGSLTQLIWNPVSDFRQVDYEIRLGATWNNGLVLGRTPLTQSPVLGDGIYWIAAHFIVPNGGQDIYSETPVNLTIAGSQITQNVMASYDQAATGWQGTFTNTSVTSLGLQLSATGNILTDPSYLTTANILFYGGSVSSGTYEIPSSQRVNIGRVAPCQIIFTLGVEVGYSLNSVNILTLPDYLNATNILGVDLGNNTSVTPQIRLSQDGSTWGSWQNWIPGSYSAMAFDAQVVLMTLDPSVLAVLADFTFTVDVPTLVQTGTNVAISSGGTAITFAKAFNGGPGSATVPNLQVTIIGGSAGDDAIITARTKSGFTLQVVNGGSGVARTVDYVAEGY